MEFCATLKSTQEEPTFGRQILGAGLFNLDITPTIDNGGQFTIPTKSNVYAISGDTLVVLRGKVNSAI